MFLAGELELEIVIYEGGILRMWVDEKLTGKPRRFRLSTHDLGSIINKDLRTYNLRELLTEESEESVTLELSEENQTFKF